MTFVARYLCPSVSRSINFESDKLGYLYEDVRLESPAGACESPIFPSPNPVLSGNLQKEKPPKAQFCILGATGAPPLKSLP